MRPWLLPAALAAFPLASAVADGMQARLGVAVQVVDLCGADSGLMGSSALIGACVSRLGMVVTVERPLTVAVSLARPGGPPATAVRETLAGPDGLGYLTVIY